MFSRTTVALVCAAAWSLAQAATADPSAGARTRPVTLEEAVARALETAPGLEAREELVSAADAQIVQSGALPNPTLDVELENFGGSGQFTDLDRSELTLGVTQRIERSSKRAGRVAVAQIDRDAAVLEHERIRLSVAFEAHKGFVEVFAAQAALESAEAWLKSASAIEALAARRVGAARDPVTVKLRAEIQTAEARTAREQAEHDLHNAKRTLSLLWGEPDAEFEIDAAVLLAPPAAHPDLSDRISPAVKAREIAARRAASKFELEQANARSDVSVGLGVRRFESGGDLAGVLSLSVPLAIFDGNDGNIGRAAAERRAADLDVAEARRQYLTTLVVLEEEAARSRAELEAIRKELLPRAKDTLAAARHGFEAGAFGYQEIAEGQRILNDLNTREIAALRQLHIAHASLDRLSGRFASTPSDRGTQP